MTNNPVAEAITKYWGDRCSNYEPNCPCCEAWAKYDAMTSTSAEPVAYQVAMSDGRWGTIFHHPDKPIGDHRPLYAHPPTPMTVEAAEKVVDALSGMIADAERVGWDCIEEKSALDEWYALSGEKS